MGNLSPHGPSAGSILPNFKFYFDFVARSWKGNTSANEGAAFSFDSYHQRFLVEYAPKADLLFMADLPASRYFEVDYLVFPRLQFRWGRIWVPFDDMSPHSIFGGRINTSEFFQVNESAFLPDIWSDLGMGLKYTLADSAKVSAELHFYVVNGFHSGGTSPVAGEGGTVAYPDFGGTSGATGDNNNEKGMGTRWHGIFGRRIGLGASAYRDTYTNTGKDPKRILMLGADAQLRPTSTTEIRLGYTTMKVGLGDGASKDAFTRTGTYVELGQRFGFEDRWKFLIRAGSSQNDNRVIDVSDKSLLGLTVLRTFGSVEAQVTYFKDLHNVPTKIAYHYGALRLVTAF